MKKIGRERVHSLTATDGEGISADSKKQPNDHRTIKI